MDQVIDERFLVSEILGAGGAGISYRCLDRVDGSDVALKVLHDDRRHGVLANRLAIEGELLELLDHKHIVPFRGLRVVGDGPVYLATEYMPGGSLEGRLRKGGALVTETVTRIGRQLALALDFIHSQGIVHRDLKPGNVLIEVAEEDALSIRLGDFGIARVFRGMNLHGAFGLTRTGMFIGTPEYAAPEQIRGEKGVGPAADAFALGALLHYSASLQPLLKRSEITDWDEFRKRARDPADRARLLDVVDVGLMVGRRDQLALLDDIIDSLLQPEADQRVSLADVALRLGAQESELTPRDVAPLAPRSLVSALDDAWFSDEVDALVPAGEISDAEGFGASLPNLAVLPSLADLSSLPASDVRSTPAALEPPLPSLSSEEPTMVSEAAQARIVAAMAARPISEVPELDDLDAGSALSGLGSLMSEFEDVSDHGPEVVPAPGLVDDWEDEIDWPTPTRRRRNRLHGALVVAACLVAGVALAWPGGPGGLLGEETVARLGEPVGDLLSKLTSAPPEFQPSAPWEGKRVLTQAASVPVLVSTARPGVNKARTPVAKSPVAKKPVAKKPLANGAVAKKPVGKTSAVKSPVRKTIATKKPGAESAKKPRSGGEAHRAQLRQARHAERAKAHLRAQEEARAMAREDRAAAERARLHRRKPAPPRPPAVGRWADDESDARELRDVVAEEVDHAQQDWGARLVREAEVFDERAESYWERAESDARRQEALFRAWDRQMRDARGDSVEVRQGQQVVGSGVFFGADDVSDCTLEEEEIAEAE